MRSWQTRRNFLMEVAGAATLGGIALPLRAQPLPADWEKRSWIAKWIAVPEASAAGYGVFHFRRTLNLGDKPQRYLVHVTSDNRYQLFVNGHRVSWGPARGDLFHWRYETVDLAPYLSAGANAITALVWYFGDAAPEAQIMLRPGFLLQADDPAQSFVNTDAAWKCSKAEAYSPLVFTSGQMHGYYVAGPGDHFDAARYPWGWQDAGFDDSGWATPQIVADAAGRDASDPHSRWMLVPRPIPAMREQPLRLQSVRRSSGVTIPAGFPAQPGELRIEPHTTATILLDQQSLTTGYPELLFSAGRGARLRLSYAETLFQKAASGGRLQKGNRNEIDGKDFLGYYDEVIADGGARRSFRPLWWRTWRYLELRIETQEEAFVLNDFRAVQTGYPFERRARFDAGSPELTRILDVGWRTASLCAHETYMDCPYYEQLQYGGDTRIQCLISVFNTGDTRLMKNAIDLLNDSRQSDGCTMSRYPTRLEQYIPAWTLWWVGMVHDYHWYVDDPAFVARMLPGVRAVIDFFHARQKTNGSLGPLPWWRNFDWVPGWKNGDPPQGEDGSSAPFDLLLLLVYRWAANLEDAHGIPALAEIYRTREKQLRTTAQALYWTPDRRLYADTPAKTQFSQHTNTLAVLADLVTGDAARDLMQRTLAAHDLAEAALFFRYYVHVALAKTGDGDLYLDQLGDWRDMLAHGLTTFAEWSDSDPARPTRSDCHAWSASPNIEIFRTVLGVDSAAPGFARISVRPHLGKLAFVSGTVPHPKGSISVQIRPEGARWSVEVSLPPGVPGDFAWRGVQRPLAPGSNRFLV